MRKIIILDKTLEQKAFITKWVSFSFERKLNSAGAFELVINANDNQAKYIDNGDLIYFEDDMCGYINHMEVVSSDNKSQEKLTISGIELKDIIGHRLIVPDDGQENVSYVSEKTGSIIVDLIDKCMISTVDADRKIDRLTIIGSNLGTAIDYSVRYKQLDTEIYNLLLVDNLGLKAGIDLNNKLMNFAVYEGIDRRYSQSDNTRALFSMRLNTLRTATTLLDGEGQKTVGYIGGEGEGVNRQVIVEYNDDTACGMDRKETFVDISDARSSGELQTRGRTSLLEMDKVYSITGNTFYKEKIEYDIGDTVTVEDRFGNVNDVQIAGIKYEFAGDSVPKKTITFGCAPRTLAQAINRRLVGINNILTK